ncbi:MAG TPA: hypothetical protein DDW52_22375 [Planctomycetaceae bacterium]|nr:hypothetical protein [Planctomycetaceae bacterium]
MIDPSAKRLPRRFFSTAISLLVLSCTTAVGRCNEEIAAPADQNALLVSSAPEQFHTVTITAEGPELSEDAEDNPFTNYRTTAVFRHLSSGKTFVVPGFFAADAESAHNSADSGSDWQARFSPPQAGRWHCKFTIAQIPAPESSVIFERETTFEVAATKPTGSSNRDFRQRGHLQYVGSRYLKFSGSGEYFLKSGVDSPETLLGYRDFDGTYRDLEQHPIPAPHAPINLPALKDGLHDYAPHVSDWRPGDPTWKRDKGKGLIGGVNYLADQGINSIYFLTMNVNGDGRNVWPWTTPWEHTRFDCSKLAQWEIVFEHMQSQGLMLHIVLQETENDHLLDEGDLGPLRKLYLREMVARFAHHPAIVWNLGEENTQTVDQQTAMAQFIRELDPYDHPIVIHNDHWSPNNLRDTFDPHLGGTALDGTAIQDFYWNDVHAQVKHYVSASAKSGKQWVVFADEMGGAQYGLRTDDDDPGHFNPRSKGLWGSLMAGGAGVEWYFGWQNNSPHSDLSAETWRTREKMWIQSRIAIDFFHRYLPFWEMKSADHLGLAYADYGFAKAGEIYCLYLFSGGATRLNLADHKGAYEVRWFDPQRGGSLQTGSVSHVWGPGWADIGEPPAVTLADAERDWVALVRKAPPHFTELDGKIAVEAEHFAAQTKDDVRRWYTLFKGSELPDLPGAGIPMKWTRSNLSAAAKASGRTFVRLLPDTRRSHAEPLKHGENFSPDPGKLGVLTYQVHFPSPGRYYVWVRAFSSNTEDNGLHVGLDGTWPASGQRIQFNNGKHQWTWGCAQRTPEVHTGVPMQIWLDIESSGLHDVHFSMREDGFAFDKFILTRDANYRPSGEGPTESLTPIPHQQSPLPEAANVSKR